MKKLLATLALTTALTMPGFAMAKPVTFTTQLNSYGGNNAFLAFYVTDASGAYKGSLWMAGGRTRYYRHLSDWDQATGGDVSQVDGITGASVGQGQQLSITLDLKDALFDAVQQRSGMQGHGLGQQEYAQQSSESKRRKAQVCHKGCTRFMSGLSSQAMNSSTNCWLARVALVHAFTRASRSLP